MKKLALLISSALLLSTQAMAETPAPTEPTEITASVVLNGKVEESCFIGADTTAFDDADLISATGEEIKANLTFACNATHGFTVSMESTNGGLVNTADVDAAEAIKVAYNATINAEGGARTVNDGSFNSANPGEAKAATFGFAATAGVLTVSTVGVEEATLKAGDYSDTLTLTIAATPSALESR